MKSIINYLTTFLYALLLISGGYSSADAQKVSYLDLARSNQGGEQFFMKKMFLPGETDSTTNFVLMFKTSYNFLAFRKANDFETKRANEHKYFATLEMNIEMYKAPENQRLSSGDSFQSEGMESVEREFWRDTVFTKTYEQTQAGNFFIEGYFNLPLPPGQYGYILQLIRTAGAGEETSRQQVISVPEYSSSNEQVYFLQPNSSMDDQKLPLINFGENVHFGKDFNALIYYPTYNPFKDYELQVHKLRQLDDSTATDLVHSETVTSDMMLNNYTLSMTGNSDLISLQMTSTNSGKSFAFVSIPNSQFPNATYRLRVLDKKNDELVSQKTYQSHWVDMPTSLLSVDVALKMLRFIIDEDKVDEMRKGSRAERRKAFEKFWTPKDPTPDTEFNELMTEYYRRIDYAFRNFSTMRQPGYESDQGKTYIRVGPPKDIKREFPTSQPVIEIWTYPDRTFIFEATTGFGDFKLVETRKNS